MMKSAFVTQCVKQCVKSASPVEDIAQAAKKVLNLGHKAGGGVKKPVVVVGVSNDTQAYPGYKHLVDIGALPHTISEEQYLKNPGKWKGYNIIAPSMPAGRGNKVGNLPADLDNKLKETQTYGKFMPKTEAVGHQLSPDGQGLVASEVHKALSSDNPLAAMDAAYGKGKWLLKDISGANTQAGQLLKGDNIAGVVKNPDGSFGFKMRDNSVQTFKPGDLMMQEMKDIKAPMVYRKIDKVLGKIIPNKIKERRYMNSLMRDTNEYRVHVMNGKVVPEGTVGRGTLSQYLVSSLTPLRTPDMRKVEDLASQVGKTIPEQHRNGLYGLDIGIDRKTGKAFLIETNPATARGQSGFLDTPQGSDAVASAYNNKMPVSKKIKLGLLGTAGAGGLALGAHELSKDDPQPKPQPKPTMAASIMSRIRQYMPQA